MSSNNYMRASFLGVGVIVCAFIAAQGCGSDSTQETPPATTAGAGGQSGSAGTAGSGTAGNAGSGTAGSGTSGTGGEAGQTGTAGSSGSSGSGGNCNGPKGCYTCTPTNNMNDQFHNHCVSGGCDCTSGECTQGFDNSSLNLPATGLPDLVPPPTPT